MTATRPLKVLTPDLAQSLSTFNEAARALQRMKIQIIGFFPTESRLQITPEGGKRLLDNRQVEGFHRAPSAGSTHFSVEFHGITLDWHQPITYRNYHI